MRRIISIPIQCRLLIKLLICVIIVNIGGVVRGGGTDDDDGQDIESAVNAATLTLQREVNSLHERLELFEMKHETLQAASEQFKIQSKSAKSKLDEERTRYETLASGKRSLETSLETKLANALEDQKTVFEDTVISEHVEKQVLLKKENEDLEENLRLLKQQQSMIERNSKTKLQEQYKRYELLEKKKSALEDKLRLEITDLKQRLSSSEMQTKSFEESWRKATAESDVKDELLQEESNKRVEEASRWEQRIQKLNAESTGLLSDLGIKEDELTKTGKTLTALSENFRKSEERIQRLENQIEAMTAKNQNLSNELQSKTNELMRSKKAHAKLVEEYEINRDVLHDTEVIVNDLRLEGEKKETMKKALQNELGDIKFELETSKSKTEQSIQEKSKLIKTYTEALNNLKLKNNGLRSELVDTKFELGNSQNTTKEKRLEISEITKAQENTIKNLESERKKLKASRTEYGNLEQDCKSKMEQSIQEKSKLTKTYTEALNNLTLKNNGLRSELVDTKIELGNSQNTTKETRLEITEITKAQENTIKNLESERKKLKASRTEYGSLEQDCKSKMEQSIQEKSKLTKTCTDALNNFTLKNNGLRSELVDTKIELGNSQNTTTETRQEIAEIMKAQENTIKNLESERKKLKASKIEYTNLERDYGIMTGQFEKSEGKVKNLLQRIDEEVANNTEITKSQRIATKTYIENLDKLTSKNTAFHSELVDMKFELENSQNKTEKSRQETVEIAKTQENTLKTLESERQKFMASKIEYVNLSKDFEMITDQFNASSGKVKSLLHRIDKEAAKNTESQKAQEDTLKNLENERKKLNTSKTEYANLKRDYETMTDQFNGSNKKVKSLLQRIDEEATRNAEIEKAQENTLKNLEDERKKLNTSRTEYANLKRDFEMMTGQFNESNGKVKSLLQRIDEEGTRNAEIQNELVDTKLQVEESRSEGETLRERQSDLSRLYEEVKEVLKDKDIKLLESNQNYKIIKEHDAILQKKLDELEVKIEELTNQLDLKDSKNSYLHKMLLETKYNFEDSQNAMKQLEERMQEASNASSKEVLQLETENKNTMRQKDVLERELQESTTLYIGVSQEINELRDQLNTTESKSTKFSHMYIDSQKAVKQLEERMQDASNASSKEVLQLETENKKTMRQKDVLERELQQSTTLYIGINQEIKVLRDQLNATESKSTKFSHMYISLKVENDVLRRNLHTASVDIQEKIVSFEQCDRQLQDSQSALKSVKDSSDHGMRSLVLQLKEKQKAHELCDEELHNAKSSLKISHDTIDRDLRIANLQLKEKEDALVQCKKRFSNVQSTNQADIGRKMHTVEAQLRKNKDEFEQCDKQLGDTRTEYSELMQEYDNVSKLNQVEIDRKIHTMDTQLKKKEDESEQCDIELRDTRTVHSRLIQEYDHAKGIIEEKETKILLQQNTIKQVVTRKSEIESLALQRQNDLTETKIRNSELTADLATVIENLTGAKSVINKTETLFLLQEAEVAELKERTTVMEKLLLHKNDPTETNIKDLESTVDLAIADENLFEAKSGIDKMETVFPLQEAEVAELKERTAVMEKVVPPITVEERSEDESQSSNDQEILDKETTQVENFKSSDSSSENDSTSTPSQTAWGPIGWFRSIVPFFQWLDYTLYRILRFGWVTNVLKAPFRSVFSIVSWVLNELLIIHDAFVSLFEFEMTFASSLLSSEKDRTGLSFLIRHSKMIVILGEVLAALLCLDLIISSFLNPKRRRRRPTAKTIEVPKTANASLLRTAKNI